MITVQKSISITSSKEKVWSFTQDFSNRTLWDHTLIEYKIIQRKPKKSIWIRMKGGIQTTLNYKLCDKANKTSLKMDNTQSLIVKGGGGSWKYTESEGITTWIQTNTIELRHRVVYLIFGPMIKILMEYHTGRAMRRAKSLMEKAKSR